MEKFASGRRTKVIVNDHTSGDSRDRAHHEDPTLWLTVEEAAALLRVRVSWLYERTRTNEVPHLKIGKYLRFDRQELLAWTRQFRRDGRGRGPLRPKDRA